MNRTRRRCLVALPALALLPPAPRAQNGPPQPQVSLRSIDAVRIAGPEATLDLTLRVVNTGPLALPLHKLRFTLSLSGIDIGQGESTAPVDIPAGGAAHIPVRLVVQGPTLVQVLLTLPGNDTLPYRIAGTAEIGLTLLQIPFSQDGVVRLPVQ